MTAQISDEAFYRDKTYSIAGINGEGLFEPQQHGLTPIMISTACWRGYHCTYEVADGLLFLTQVNLGLGVEDLAAAEHGEGPKLFGKVPRRYTTWESSGFKVDGLREVVPFTGGLLLGDDFIPEMYDHLGFPPAYTFRVVHELVFDAGRLVEEHDRSAQIAEFREIEKPAPYARLVRRSPIDTVPQEVALTYYDVLLGSGEECDVILPHPSIARQHAWVKRHKQGYVLFALKSTHGTYVNGRPIVENLLKEGWVVWLGEVEFVFYGTSPQGRLINFARFFA